MGNTRTLILARCGSLIALFSSTLVFPTTVIAATPFVHETVDGAVNAGSYTSLAIDSQGRTRVSYQDVTSLDLKYASKSGALWTIERVDAVGNVGYYTSLALDALGNPHVSYHDGTNTALNYASRSNSTWIIESVDAAGTVGTYTSIALDVQGAPRVTYYDLTNGDLKYASKSGSSWTIETVDVTGSVGTFSSLVLDGDGNPRVSYYDSTNDDLKYASKTGSSPWSIQTVDATGIVGLYTSLALDAQGNPRVMYHDSTNDDLKYASKNGSTWTIEIADATGSVGLHTSVALDAQGNPRVSYYDSGNNELKYAFRSTTAWTTEIVDPTGDLAGSVGQYTSLALDAQGNPRISHYNATNGDLKYSDAAVHVLSPGGGIAWAVGSLEDIRWAGSGVVDIYLSVDGGRTFDLLFDNHATNTFSLRVPHAPTRFARVRIIRASPLSHAFSDSFFTIDATITLAKFDASRGDDGTHLTWETRPGPQADIRYRIERSVGGDFSIVADALDRGEFVDASTTASARYRLIAINGLGEEYVMGETSVTGALAVGRDLSIHPNPARGGTTTFLFRAPFDAASGGSSDSRIEVAMFDLSGRRIVMLADGQRASGVHSATWNGRDDAGRDVAAGVYFARLSWNGAPRATERVTVVR